MWSNLLQSSTQEDSKEIYFVYFGHFLKFLLIFKVWKQFLLFNNSKKDLNPPHSVGIHCGSQGDTNGLAQKPK
jgi:hypothetical protein